MKIFPEPFERNAALRFLGSSFIALGFISCVLTGLALVEKFATSTETDTSTIAFQLAGPGETPITDNEIQNVEPAAGEMAAAQKVVVVR